MSESWKDVKGYEGLYKISDKGRVLSLLKGDKILKPYLDNQRGHLIIGLRKNNIQKTLKVHRLVAEAFLQKVTGKKYVIHKSLNKTDNSIENLYYGDWKDVQTQAYKNGTKYNHFSSLHPKT